MNHYARVILTLLHLLTACLKQKMLYSIPYGCNPGLCAGLFTAITVIPQFQCWEDGLIIFEWESMELDIFPQLDFG